MLERRSAPRMAPPEDMEERRATPRGCAEDGHCGPFMNRSYYASHGAWGYGDCVECGRTVPVPRDRDLGGMIEAIIPPI